jgi:hypothetical protein
VSSGAGRESTSSPWCSAAPTRSWSPPGNPLIPGSIDAPPESIDADLFVVGPEAPLVDGLADRLRAQGKLVFGPGADGAHLEGSKAWMKEIAADADVPTARHGTFTQRDEAEAFLDTLGDLYVIKTDGLAAGKGVLVTADRVEASEAVAGYLSGHRFGDAGRRVVIEEGMTGPELSLLAVCDGRRAVALAPAQDFKRVFDGDQGPNTGGMGAYSPVPIVDDDLVAQVMDRFVEPTLATLRERGIDYRGVLYAGLMLTAEGPKLVEYNVRFGDPEAQVVLPATPAISLRCLPRRRPARWPPTPPSSTMPRSRSWPPPRDTRSHPAAATSSKGSTRPAPWRGSPSSVRASPATIRAGSSPPGVGSCRSPPSDQPSPSPATALMRRSMPSPGRASMLVATSRWAPLPQRPRRAMPDRPFVEEL